MTRLRERQDMVERQIAARGVSDSRVLAAIAAVPREHFVPLDQAASAYFDQPLAIGEGQTISQPFVVALMLEALQLQGGERLLEVGAGSGYAAAVAAQIAGHVYAIERIPALADLAQRNLARAGIGNVEVRCSDGTLGWPEVAPFDAILVSAGGPEVPRALQAQLPVDGRLVIPAGRERYAQRLLRITKRGAEHYEEEDLGTVSFVPLIGAGGWREPD